MDIATALASINQATRERVGPATTIYKVASGKSIVNVSPSNLASQAGLDLDVYSLARMVSSEYGGHKAEEMLGSAECAVNQAAHLGITVTSLLTRTSHESWGTGGFYARNDSGHWASTIQDPNQKHVAAAKAAIGGSQLAKGARDFFSPGGQIPGAVQGDTVLRRSAQQYIDDNAKVGLVWVGPIPGVNQSSLMMFADKAKVSNPDQSEEMSAAAVNELSITAFLFLLGTVTLAFAAKGGF